MIGVRGDGRVELIALVGGYRYWRNRPAWVSSSNRAPAPLIVAHHIDQSEQVPICSGGRCRSGFMFRRG
jgi:hypothetical protein